MRSQLALPEAPRDHRVGNDYRDELAAEHFGLPGHMEVQNSTQQNYQYLPGQHGSEQLPDHDVGDPLQPERRHSRRLEPQLQLL